MSNIEASYSHQAFLESEASLIFIEAGPLGNSSKWQKPPLVAVPDNYNGGQLLGAQFCNQVHPGGGRRLVIFEGPVGNSACAMRVQGFLDHVNMKCKETIRTTPLTRTANWDYWQAFTHMETLLAYQPDIDAVFGCNDLMALGAADLSLVRDPTNSRSMIFMGYDNRSEAQSYLKRNILTATIDQQVFYRDRGLAPTMLKLAPRLVEAEDAPFTSEAMVLRTPVAVNMPALAEVPWEKIMENEIRQQLLKYHGKNSPPAQQPVASVSVASAQVIEVDMHSQSMTVILSILLGWNDTRMTWDCNRLGSAMSSQIAELWVPEYTIESIEVENFNLDPVEPLVYRLCTGEARLRRRLRATVVCQFFKNMGGYPFDQHTCPIRWRSSSVELVDASSNVELAMFSIYNLSFGRGKKSSSNLDGKHEFLLSYPLTLDRQAEGFYLNIVVPACFLNVLSFLQHWIPRSGSFDRAALGATAVLSALTLQTAFTIPTHSFNWGIAFLLITLAFHFLPLAATVFGSKYTGSWDEDFYHTVREASLSYGPDRESTQMMGPISNFKAASPPGMNLVRSCVSMTQMSTRVLGLWAEPAGDLFAKRCVIPLYSMMIIAVSLVHVLHWSGQTYMWICVAFPAAWLFISWLCFCYAFIRRGKHLAMLVGVHPEKELPRYALLEYLLPGNRGSGFRRECLQAIGAVEIHEGQNMTTHSHFSMGSEPKTQVSLVEPVFASSSKDVEIECFERLHESPPAFEDEQTNVPDRGDERILPVHGKVLI